MKKMIYERTKILCDKNTITIAKLERELNFSEGSISKWKTSTPSADKIISIAKFFNVSIDYIVGHTLIQQTTDNILSDKNIISIQIAREHMTEDDKEKMMTILRVTFQDSFTD